MRIPSFVAAALLSIGVGAPLAAQPAAITTAFTYQGELTDSAGPASGVYDFRFDLYTSDGVTVGFPQCADNVQVVNGRFTVELNFGQVFASQQRWLEIRVRPDPGLGCADTTGFTTLSPRQQFTAAPFALRALESSNADALGGQSPSFYSSATNLTFGTLSDFRLSSNVSLLGGAQTFSAAKTFNHNTLLMRNSGNTFSTTLNAPSATGTRALSLPDASGTLISTGNLLSITSVGTIASGVWNGTAIGVGNGGTGANLSATGGAGQVVKQLATGGALTVGTLSASDIPATAGDLSGAYASPTVTRLQGRTVASTAPADAQVLRWNNALSRWEPGADLDTNTTYSAGSGLTLAGTVFSIPADAVTPTMLASNVSSLSKVSGGIMTATGTRIGINTVPASGKDLHVAGNVQFDGTITTSAQTRYYTVGGNEFRNRSNTTISDVLLQESSALGGLDCSAVVTVHLPHGATVTSVEAYWFDTSANSATVTLSRTGRDTGSGASMASVISLGNTGITATVDNTIVVPTVDNSAYFYMLRTDWTTTATGDISLLSVRITYTVTAPLP